MHKEYELAGIETIARGVAVCAGKVLLCRARGSRTSYLPGGHIEFGETGREALAREMKEETALDVKVGRFLGVVENSFEQNGRPHAEINLVYEMDLGPEPRDVVSAEDWIEFEWRDLADLGSANVLPADFNVLAADPSHRFDC